MYGKIETEHMNIQFLKQIHGTFASVSSSDIWLSKTLDLPSIPAIGTTVRDGDFAEVVHEIVHDARKGTVTVIVAADKELHDEALDYIRNGGRRSDDYLEKRVKIIAERYIKKHGWEQYE